MDENPTSLTPNDGGRDSRISLITRFFAILAVILAVTTGALLAGQFPGRPILLLALLIIIFLVVWDNPNVVAHTVLDWLPVLVIAVGYDLVRSQAPSLITRAITEPQLKADELLFFGTVPTVRLQRAIPVSTSNGSVQWWGYLMTAIYVTHFLVAPIVALWIYIAHREWFSRFAALIVSVTVCGFITYFALPATPPWLASRQGDLASTIRVAHLVWQELGITELATIFNGNARLANPVAALPSLHAAWPLMMLLFLWPRIGQWRWALLAYNVAMDFVLVYGAEHYLSDILLGWIYTIIVFVVVTKFMDRKQPLVKNTSENQALG